MKMLTFSGESVSMPTFTMPWGSVAPGNTCPPFVVPMKTLTKSVRSPRTADVLCKRAATRSDLYMLARNHNPQVTTNEHSTIKLERTTIPMDRAVAPELRVQI